MLLKETGNMEQERGDEKSYKILTKPVFSATWAAGRARAGRVPGRAPRDLIKPGVFGHY